MNRNCMTTTDNENEICATIDARADAIRNKNVPGIIHHFTEDSVGFSLAPPVQAKAALTEDLEDWFATFRGPIGLEMRDLRARKTEEKRAFRSPMAYLML
jgi:ketosteroid isomerase-like protein